MSRMRNAGESKTSHFYWLDVIALFRLQLRYLQPGDVFSKVWAELFDGRLTLTQGLNFNPGLFFFSSKAFSRKIFSILFRVFNHQIVDKKN